MQDSKVLEIIRKLNADAVKRLRKFLRSPYFTESNLCVELVEYIFAHLHKKTEAEALQKERVFAHLFPNEAYSRNRLNVLLSELLRLLEQFVWAELGRDKSWENIKESMLFQHYSLLNAPQNYKDHLFSAQKGLKQAEHQDNLNHFLRYWTELQVAQFRSTENPTLVVDFTDSVHSLNTFFIASRLEICCYLASISTILSDQDSALITETLAMLEMLPQVQEEPVIAIYHATLRMLQQEQVSEWFHRVNALLATYQAQNLLSQRELLNLESYLRNFRISQINKGDDYFTREQFLRNQEVLAQKQHLSTGGNINPLTFRNMFLIALSLNEWDWAQAFWEENRVFLPEDKRTSIEVLTQAQLAAAQGDWKKASKLLPQIFPPDMIFDIDLRLLWLKFYYEGEDWEALSSEVAKFRVFLTPGRKAAQIFSPAYKERLLRFVNFLSKLQRFKEKGCKQEEQQELLQQLQNTDAAEIRWLRRMATSLKA